MCAGKWPHDFGAGHALIPIDGFEPATLNHHIVADDFFVIGGFDERECQFGGGGIFRNDGNVSRPDQSAGDTLIEATIGGAIKGKVFLRPRNQAFDNHQPLVCDLDLPDQRPQPVDKQAQIPAKQ